MLTILKKLCCCSSTAVDIAPPQSPQNPRKVHFNNYVNEPPIPKKWDQTKQVNLISDPEGRSSPQNDFKEQAASPTPEEMDLINSRRPFVFPPEVELKEEELPSIEQALEGWEFSPTLVKEFNQQCESPETCTGSQQELAQAFTAYQAAWLCTKAIRRPLPLPRKY